MDTLTELIARRGQSKAILTRFNTFFNKHGATKITELQTRLEKLEESYSEFCEIQSQIELLVADDKSEQKRAENERENYENEYFDTVAKAKDVIGQNSNTGASNTAQGGEVTNESVGVESGAYSQARLPTLGLPKFWGEYDKWTQFAETFQILVSENRHIDDIQKFYYLLDAVQGDAKRVLESLEVTRDNYKVAWQLLKDRFENKNLIIQSHLKALIDVQPVTKESNQSLRKLLDNTEKHLRALNALGEPVKTWDRLIIFFIGRKLDLETKKEWEEKTITIFNGNPSFADFANFLANKCRILETIEPINKFFTRKQAGKIVSHAATSHSGKCHFCSGTHAVYRCFKWLALPVPSRLKEIKRMKLCVNCLRPNHALNACRSEGCKKCSEKHNTALHEDAVSGGKSQANESGEVPAEVSGSSGAAQTESNVVATAINKKHVILPTAVILIQDHSKNFVSCRAMLDSGSQLNFITATLARRLKIKTHKINTQISGISDTNINAANQVHAKIKSAHNNFTADLPFLILSNITTNLPVESIDATQLNLPANLTLADPNFGDSREIDVLLGAGIFFELMCAGQIKLSNSKLVLQKSVLGWIVSGQMAFNSNNFTGSNVTCHAINREDQEMQLQLEKFWCIEECVQKKFYSKEESECEELFQKTFKRNTDGRFIVTLPLKENEGELGDSLDLATKRFLNLENKLRKDITSQQQYTDFINEYIHLGHMSEINPTNVDFIATNRYYMPHHGVVNENSTTTKLRVVFDASAKTTSGYSLNDLLKIGPNVQDDLFCILLRFRKHNVVLTADIAKMYRQVNIIPEQHNLQLILWRQTGDEKIKHYCLNTVTYGTASASFLATRCIKQIALEIQHEQPKISNIIACDFYVDDLITGANDESEAIEIAREISGNLKKSCFDLRKWSSNSPVVLEALGKTQSETIGYYITSDDKRKTLGVVWKPNDDVFENIVHTQSCDRSVTKRQILSVISKLFDPLGMLGPVIVIAKIMLQRLWQLKLGWDEAVPLQIYTAWNEFYSKLNELNLIKIPRQAILKSTIEVSLHGFCDASEQAYGACIYLRSVDQTGNICVRLLCAKSRVAPLKKLSLPRLELCGAVLLTRLSKTAVSALQMALKGVQYWCDSTITLSWISREPSAWKVFVANRVAEIQSASDKEQWFHVCSADNPADLISRGVDPCQLNSNTLWWSGPTWLSQPPEKWPKESGDQTNTSLEQKKTKNIALTASTVDDESIFSRYSTLYKLTRVVAWCFRFYDNVGSSKQNKRKQNLSVHEIQRATHSLLRLAQKGQFKTEIHDLNSGKPVHKRSKIKSLDPFLDNDKLLRVGGRIRKAKIEFGTKFPIILPQRHPLTNLIILDQHHKQLHAGPQSILSLLRETYWPINGRNAVRSVLTKCITCFRANPTASSQKMGDLPSDRVNPSRPFLITGLDFAGPFNIKDGKLRNRNIIKAYMCLFICFSTKAVHIELVNDLTTHSFLNCLKRFVSRRGLCAKLYSDNATNFVGANNELKRIFNLVSDVNKEGDVYNFCIKSGIEWVFIPPKSPHQGGFWESAIKRAKYHITRVVGNRNLTYEELETVFTQVEAILNSRPITPTSNDPKDLSALTPGHFLIGTALNTFPQQDVSNYSSNRLSQYHALQQMYQQFWARWSREYLQSLQLRRKWQQESTTTIPVGALVVLIDENSAPLQWKMGRVLELHPGQDGLVRVVTVKTSAGIVKRAVQKVCVLPTLD